MAQHKYWQALCMMPATPATLELSEFHLYAGGTRVDAGATLSASAVPSGALTNLKDDNTGSGCYWSSGGSEVVLTWEFATPQAVDGIVLGARNTASRWPLALLLRGGDAATGSGPSPEYTEWMAFAPPPFVSTAKTGVLAPLPAVRDLSELAQTVDIAICGGAGYVPFIVEREILPRTTPPSYTPQWAKVRLERDIDGRVIQEQWSDRATGEGTFHNVDEAYTYTVTAIYPESGMRAVVADRIVPLVYPASVLPT